MKRLCIVAAKRTPQGRFMGGLARRSPVELAVAAGQAALDRIKPEAIDQVILGNVLAAGHGMNIARQVAVRLGVPIDRPAFTVNMMCASGMQAAALAAQAIQLGRAQVVLCGGTESMTNAPYLLDRARLGYKLGDGVLVDSLLRDGLVDPFDLKHMGLSAERLAEQYHIPRATQDAFAVESQRKYAQAQANGAFDDELVEVDGLARDEHPRPGTTLQDLADLKPAFKPEGTVTAGNASGINDGAAVLVLCDEATAQAHGWAPLATVRDWASVGCDPKTMGLGPVHATRKVCDQLGCAVSDFDTIELNEAFAVQALACAQELQVGARVLNPHGGAIALGHPIGASGARLLVHLAHLIARGKTTRGLATLCVGGGMGMAMVLERT